MTPTPRDGHEVWLKPTALGRAQRWEEKRVGTFITRQLAEAVIHFEVTAPDAPQWYQLAQFEIRDGRIGVCRDCGCTQHRACRGGCYWVEPDLCSTCVEEN